MAVMPGDRSGLAKSLTYVVKDLAVAPRRAGHLRRVEATARRTRCADSPDVGSCTTRCHRELGYRGWAIRRSRTFTPLSLTLLRERRIAWHTDDTGDAEPHSWRPIGRGETPFLGELAAELRLGAGDG